MNIDYDKIARESGYSLTQFGINGDWAYVDPNNCVGYFLYDTAEEAWKACCVENGLVEEE